MAEYFRDEEGQDGTQMQPYHQVGVVNDCRSKVVTMGLKPAIISDTHLVYVYEIASFAKVFLSASFH